MAAFARRSPSARLYSGVPRSSQWPSMSRRARGLDLSQLALASSVFVSAGRTSYLSKSKLMSLSAEFSANSRGDTRPELSVRAGAVLARPAPAPTPAPVPDCEAIGRVAPVAPVDAPGEGEEADAGIVAGCFAHPLAARIKSAVGIIRTLRMSGSSSTFCLR